MSGDVRSVRFEGLIPEKTEALIEFSDGSREVLQCKAGADPWTTTRLHNDGLLVAMRNATERGDRFRFVSIATCALKEVAELANKYHSNLAEFLQQVQGRKKADQLTELETKLASTQDQIWKILGGSEFVSMDPDTAEKLAHRSLAPWIQLEARSAVFNALEAGLSNPAAFLGSNITSALIDDWLSRQGITGWKAASRSDQDSALRTLTNSFCPSPVSPLRRNSVDDIVAFVTAEASSVVVSGSGGTGKSEILRQAAVELENQGWAVAAINIRELPESLDRLPGYYQAVGLPIGVVESLAGRTKSCLILDQMDSEAPALGGSGGRWSVVRHLIQKAKEYDLRIVLGSRPITDLGSMDGSFTFVTVPPLTREEVIVLVGTDHPFPHEITATPALAVLWRRMASSVEHPSTIQELLMSYRAFVAQSCDATTSEIAAVESIVSKRKSESGALSCPLNHLVAHEALVHRLVGFGYLRKRNQNVEFEHEIIAEFAWASAFDANGGNVSELLAGQRLHTNRLLRDLLEFLANSPGRNRELVTLLTKLHSIEMRPQVVSVALVWMSTCPENVAAVVWPSLRKQIFHVDSWRRSLARQVLRLSCCRFFDLAFADGSMHTLLNEESGASYLTWIAEGSCRNHDQTVEQLAGLISQTDGEGDLVWRKLAVSHPTSLLVGRWVSLLSASPTPNDFLPDFRETHSLQKNSADALIEIFAAWLERHDELAHELGFEGPFFWRYQGIPNDDHLPEPSELVEASPETYFRLVGPRILRAVRALADPAEIEVLCTFGDRDDQAANGMPSSYAGKLLFSLESSVAMASGEGREIFDSQRGFHDSASIRVCCLTLLALDEMDTARIYLSELAAACVQTTNWAHVACLRLVSAIKEENAAASTEALTWDSGQPWFDENGLLLAGEVTRSSVEGFFVGSPFDDVETTTWTDDKWITVISRSGETEREIPWGPRSGGPHEISRQLQIATETDPARFLLLIDRLRPEHPWQYLSAILTGARKLDPAEVDIDWLCRSSIQADPAGHCLAALVDFVCNLEQQKVSEIGTNALLGWSRMRRDPDERWIASSENWVASDTAWRNRIDTTAVSGLGRYFAVNPENLDEARGLVTRAIAESDEPLGGAILQALLWVLPDHFSVVEDFALRLLSVFPELADSRSTYYLVNSAWQRSWAFLGEYWEALATCEPGSSKAGYRLVGNRVRQFNLPNREFVAGLPERSRIGFARAVVDCCKSESVQRWAAEILRYLLSDPSAEVRKASSHWWECFKKPQERELPLQLPQVFRELLGKTICEASNFFSVQSLWLALAMGSPDEAREVCIVLNGGSSPMLPRADLAYGYEVDGQLEIARLAYETLLNNGEEPDVALDAIDELIRSHPEAARVQTLFDQTL
jgi:hypothetical protein